MTIWQKMLKKQATKKVERADCHGLDTGTVQRKGCLAFVPEVKGRTAHAKAKGIGEQG